ncbi:streptophobe family protein [Streptomyces sp. URMC 123]|uniref:streptophobe family protein n=1 Tax=Streptomyces sp. URMC 123 TaxID=3423403 RepID=UPI003F1CD155
MDHAQTGQLGTYRGAVMGTSRSRSIRPGELLLSSIAAVSWAFLGMVGIAALGLHLLGADVITSLGPMTAATVVLAVGGRVHPSGDVEIFGLEGAEARTAIEFAPLGVALVGALLLSWTFLRSLRGAGPVIGAGELAARAATVTALFLALLGGLAWVGNDTVTLDGSTLVPDGLGADGSGGSGPGGDGPGASDLPGLPDIPGLPDDIAERLPGGLGDLGDPGGGLPDRLADLVGAEATVGFRVDLAGSLLGGLAWVLAVLLIALLASRRTPLPRGWDALHRRVRPAASALRATVLLAVGAGLVAGASAAAGDDRPGRVFGAALLAAPNGVWMGLPLGLFVPWRGTADGALVNLLPDPLNRLLTAEVEEPVTLGRLAELDSRVWLLAVAAAVAMLGAGALTAVRTPRGGGGSLAFAGRCALSLAGATALALPLLALVTRVSVDAGVAVFGIDAFDAGLELRGSVPWALPLGAAWGAAAGAVGALLALAAGAAGRRVAPLAAGPVAGGAAGGGGGPEGAAPGPYRPSPGYRPPNPATNPYLRWDPGTMVLGGRPPSAPPSASPSASPSAPPDTGSPPGAPSHRSVAQGVPSHGPSGPPPGGSRPEGAGPPYGPRGGSGPVGEPPYGPRGGSGPVGEPPYGPSDTAQPVGEPPYGPSAGAEPDSRPPYASAPTVAGAPLPLPPPRPRRAPKKPPPPPEAPPPPPKRPPRS